MHTYVYEAGDTTPYLIVTSAERRSGKTRLLECLAATVRRPVFTSSTTEAALFRAIDKWKPTLLIDETDALFKNGSRDPSERQEAIRAILNSGFRMGTSVIRCENVGGKQDVAEFGIYCPKALAGIGHLPDTIADRGIPIRLRRRTNAEPIERFRYRLAEESKAQWNARLSTWAAFHSVTLGDLRPEMPEDLDDRAQDAYEILLAIAGLGGDDWLAMGSASLVALRLGGEPSSRESTNSSLLRDLSLALEMTSQERIYTRDLLQLLFSYGEQPWVEWWIGRGAEPDTSSKKAARRLAMVLADYGLESIRYADGEENRRGYVVADLREVCARYLAANTETRKDAANEHIQHGKES